MSEQRPPYVTTPTHPVAVDVTRPDWELKLCAKIRELRLTGKRCMLLVDGSRIFVFSAEPRGTIAID